MRSLFLMALILMGVAPLSLAVGGGHDVSVALLLCGAVFGWMGVRSYFRARRQRAALDAYAEREIARRAPMQTLTSKGN